MQSCSVNFKALCIQFHDKQIFEFVFGCFHYHFSLFTSDFSLWMSRTSRDNNPIVYGAGLKFSLLTSVKHSYTWQYSIFTRRGGLTNFLVQNGGAQWRGGLTREITV